MPLTLVTHQDRHLGGLDFRHTLGVAAVAEACTEDDLSDVAVAGGTAPSTVGV